MQLSQIGALSTLPDSLKPSDVIQRVGMASEECQTYGSVCAEPQVEVVAHSLGPFPSDSATTAVSDSQDSAMSKKLGSKRRFPLPEDLDEKENTPRKPSLKENTDYTGPTGGPTADLDTVVTRDIAFGAQAVQAVTSPLVLAPVFPTLPVEPSTVVAPTAPQTPEANSPADVEGLYGESSDDTNGRLGLAGSRSKQNRWIKHTLASGLVIEVEPTISNGLLPSLTEITNRQTLHRPIEAVVKTPSPEPPQSQNDDYTHMEDWLLSPRQGGDPFFEQYMEDLRARRELPFYQDADWRGAFIPTLLRFLGTRSDPWEWSGDAFLSILPDIWLTVYHESSWRDEDDALVRSLAMDSVAAWFESFASNALAAVEKSLKSSTDGSPDFSKWSGICEGMMRDYHMSFARPDGPDCSDLFSSIFVLAPLSAHLRAIRGGRRVEGLIYSSDELEFPFGAISLAAAAAFRAMLLFREQLVGIDEEGNVLVMTSADGDAEPRGMDTAFTKYTAEGRTRRCSSLACNLPRYRMDVILAQAHDVLYADDDDEINSDNEI